MNYGCFTKMLRIKIPGICLMAASIVFCLSFLTTKLRECASLGPRLFCGLSLFTLFSLITLFLGVLISIFVSLNIDPPTLPQTKDSCRTQEFSETPSSFSYFRSSCPKLNG